MNKEVLILNCLDCGKKKPEKELWNYLCEECLTKRRTEAKQKDEQIRSLEEQLKNAIVPKFKIGQKVCVMDYVFDYKIYDTKITSICVFDDGVTSYCCGNCLPYAVEEPYVFNTREEVEKRLAELEGK